MSEEIKKELLDAKKLYKSKNYSEALEIYEKHYHENSEEYNKWDKIFYSWAIYQVYIKDYDDETELIEFTQLITELIRQSDLNKRPTCAYTLSVFKVLDYLYKERDYEYLLYWLDKIDPALLDAKQSEFNGRIYPSRREKYYTYSSKAYLETKDYTNCILISEKALNEFHHFANDNDVWFNWRIAKSLKELNKPENALTYLEKVSKVKRDWFVSKEIAENYFMLDDKENALKYIIESVLTDEPPSLKINLFYLIYQLLKDDKPELALEHAKLFEALKLEYGASIPEDIEKLMIDENELDIDKLEQKIKDYWLQYKFKDQKLQYGTITKVFEHGKSGFITSDEGEHLFFNAYEFKSDMHYMNEGQYVSFYTKTGFDRSKNKESVNAANININ